MKLWNRTFVVTLFVLPMIFAPPSRAQTSTPKVEKQAASPEADAQKKNTALTLPFCAGMVATVRH